MNLHEIYQTLLKRGMPELGHGFTYHDHGDEVGVCPALNGHFIPEPIAQDLITLDALRWLLDEPAYGPSILEAILAATAHLEKK